MTEQGGPSLRRGGWDFFGRDRELAELVAGLEDALDGQGGLILLAGEPGIGKTRLAEQLAAHAAERGARVIWGRCWEGGGAPPYWPWVQVVRALADTCDDQTLTAWLGSGAAYLAQLAPDLADRLGALGLTPAPSVESDAARFYLFEATARFLKCAAVLQPLLLAFDDLHAADAPSLLLLRYLARDLRGARVLIVGTYRDVDVGPQSGLQDALAELVRSGHLTTLRGLSLVETAALIRDLSGTVPSEAVAAAVHEATEGNPLFVREAVRLLAAAGRLQQPGRPDVPIPGSVRALIQQRLAPLTAVAVHVLSVAAVVGRDFDLTLVGPACDLPTERVLAAISEALALGLVVEDTGGPGRYRFAHSLMREVTYEALPIPVRAALHRAVGAAIERLHGADSDRHVAELARHFAEVASAGESERALTYARRAGDRALRAHAYEEAVAEYQRALHALEIHGPDDALRCDLLLQLGAAQVRAGRYADARETHLHAVEIARRLGAPDRLARAVLGYGEPHVEGGHVNRQLVALLRDALAALDDDHAALRARLLARLSVELTFSDEDHLIDALSTQAVEVARTLDDPAALGHALDARWMAVWGPDGLAERTALAAELLQVARTASDRDLELLGRAQRATSALEAGDILAVEADIAAHARVADELRMPVHQWVSTTMRAMRALLRGDFAEGERLAGDALAIQPERPNGRWAHLMELSLVRWEQGRLSQLHEVWQSQVERFPRLAIARAWLGLADVERGDHDAARRALGWLAERLPTLTRSGLWLPGAALAAFLCAELDDPVAAGPIYATLLPYAGHVVAMTMEQPVVCFGAVGLHLGLLATAAARWSEAAEHLDAAIRAHERLGAGPLLARTQFEYARLLFRRGDLADRARADDLLGRAGATAQALGMAGLVRRIEAVSPVKAAAALAQTSPTAGPDRGRLSDARPGPDPKASGGDPDADVAPASATLEPASAGPGARADGAAGQAERDRFEREGEFWTVSYDGAVVRLKDSKGLRQIAALLAQPGRELLATDLEALVGGAVDPAASRSGRRADHGEVGLRQDAGDAGELLDAEAKAAYKVRLIELEEDLAEAEAFNDPDRAEQLRSEREFLVRELARAVGLGGRDRRAASHAERARLNATRAIRAALGNIQRAHPALGRHFAATIRTGRYCSYTPDPRMPVTWEL